MICRTHTLPLAAPCDACRAAHVCVCQSVLLAHPSSLRVARASASRPPPSASGTIPPAVSKTNLPLLIHASFEGNPLTDPVPGDAADTRDSCERTVHAATSVNVQEA
jgi:hypothetical protein